MSKTKYPLGPVSDTLAWQAGYRAEKHGQGTAANPYRDGQAEKSYWQMGWEAARRNSTGIRHTPSTPGDRMPGFNAGWLETL